MNLIGDCQGGWLAAIYAALYPERVNTLTLAGAPIDFHCGEPVIHEVLSRLAPDGDLRFSGLSPPRHQSLPPAPGRRDEDRAQLVPVGRWRNG